MICFKFLRRPNVTPPPSTRQLWHYHDKLQVYVHSNDAALVSHEYRLEVYSHFTYLCFQRVEEQCPPMPHACTCSQDSKGPPGPSGPPVRIHKFCHLIAYPHSSLSDHYEDHIFVFLPFISVGST